MKRVREFLQDLWFEMRYHTLAMSCDTVWVVGGIAIVGSIIYNVLQGNN